MLLLPIHSNQGRCDYERVRERIFKIQYVSSIEITKLGGSHMNSSGFHVFTFPHKCWSKTLRNGKDMKVSIWEEYVFVHSY